MAFEPLESRLVLSGSPLVISEFLASNDITLSDEDGDSSDYIEIHNASAAAYDLSGWYLTDDSGDPDKWQFPSVTIDTGGYLVVFAFISS